MIYAIISWTGNCGSIQLVSQSGVVELSFIQPVVVEMSVSQSVVVKPSVSQSISEV